MAYREKDTKKWTAQWFETNAMGEKKKRRKRGFETKREWYLVGTPYCGDLEYIRARIPE